MDLVTNFCWNTQLKSILSYVYHLWRPPARAPCVVRFNDGLLDMYRMRFKSYFKNPGVRMQTDKRKDMAMTFEARRR